MSLIDTVGAFCPHGRFEFDPIGEGLLSGLTFVVRDLIDVEGHVTGVGNPRWLTTYSPVVRTSPCITALRRAGARMIGKTVTDELAYSVHRDNVHYGTPKRYSLRCPLSVKLGSGGCLAPLPLLPLKTDIVR